MIVVQSRISISKNLNRVILTDIRSTVLMKVLKEREMYVNYFKFNYISTL